MLSVTMSVLFDPGNPQKPDWLNKSVTRNRELPDRMSGIEVHLDWKDCSYLIHRKSDPTVCSWTDDPMLHRFGCYRLLSYTFRSIRSCRSFFCHRVSMHGLRNCRQIRRLLYCNSCQLPSNKMDLTLQTHRNNRDLIASPVLHHCCMTLRSRSSATRTIWAEVFSTAS